ncbi:hypothetical protein [Mesorhizobium sp. ES1-4]|uniref:hypothetical protein n=1 Tax=Mesorhizobium sp. ES1-4 TaxID=2876627 RepID=UPI001CCE29DB|nr:hypothetical protein [Mesorhizobium sp. ES1-4]MBZ9794334.1 hypothetical protein [Mesorhizobium sp. ES1-4]
MNRTDTIWALTIIGPVILAAVIIYALANQRRLSRRAKAQQDESVNDLYDDPEGHSSPAGEVRAAEAKVRPPQK